MKVLVEDRGWIIFCPGCKCNHLLDYPRWTFNGDFDFPTFSPSLLLITSDATRDRFHQCHSFIRNGKIEFLSDCEHDLASQTVDLPEIEE